MKEPKDKRTKAYKDWKKQFEEKNSIGLGDVVEKVTATTYIKKAVEFIAGEDCGCNKRKEKLNKIRFRFPAVRCFTEQQYNSWVDFRNKSKKGDEWIDITNSDQVNIIIPIYAHVFVRQLKPMNCCLDQYLNDIDRVYNTYQ